MASNTRETWKRRLARRAKAGRKRKNQDARHSTPSNDQLFAGMGEPGQPAPKAAIKAPAKPPVKSAPPPAPQAR
jgi:hypothetical protein